MADALSSRGWELLDETADGTLDTRIATSWAEESRTGAAIAFRVLWSARSLPGL
jgi:hypothetical protein